VDPAGTGVTDTIPVDSNPPDSAESSSGGGGGGGGGGCLISTAVNEFPIPNQILGILIFFGLIAVTIFLLKIAIHR
jgi:hypothetical protein